MDNIHVVIRLRPLIDLEKTENANIHWHVNGNMIYPVDNKKTAAMQSYIFDKIFDCNSSTSVVFEETGRPILNAIMEGYNGTIFAYGQTSSGKTHTMMGDKREGVIPRMVEALFQSIENSPLRRFLLRVSYMEIYNEKVYDLLGDSKKPLNVREDLKGRTFVENLNEEFVSNSNDVLALMKKGESNRSYGATFCNKNSSRSHTIFRMIIESAELSHDCSANSGSLSTDDSDSVVMVSHLNLVDLAGSERVWQNSSTSTRFKEGCAINTSLFVLGTVIGKLSQGDGQFINFRDSKLTRILQPSLGGNAKTSIICTITPAAIEETISTLKFASTAKTIKNKPTVNEVLSDEALLKRYIKEIEVLQKELAIHKQINKDQEIKEMEMKLQETSQKNQELEEKLKILNTRIITSSLATSLPDVPKNRRETWGGHLRRPCRQDNTVGFSSVLFNRDTLKSRSSILCNSLYDVSPNRDVACQVDFSFTKLDDSNEEEIINEVELLKSEISRLQHKIFDLTDKLGQEKWMRCNAEERCFAGNETFMFLKEENLIQEKEIKALQEIVENHKKCDCNESVNDYKLQQALLENAELRSHTSKLEEDLVKLSRCSHICQQEHSPLIATNEALQRQLVDSKLKIDTMAKELVDTSTKFELQVMHGEALKNELRDELQKAFDYIKCLQSRTMDPSDVELRHGAKCVLDKSAQALVTIECHSIGTDVNEADISDINVKADLKDDLLSKLMEKEAIIQTLEKQLNEIKDSSSNLIAECKENLSSEVIHCHDVDIVESEEMIKDFQSTSADKVKLDELLEESQNSRYLNRYSRISSNTLNNRLETVQSMLVKNKEAEDKFEGELQCLMTQLQDWNDRFSNYDDNGAGDVACYLKSIQDNICFIQEKLINCEQKEMALFSEMSNWAVDINEKLVTKTDCKELFGLKANDYWQKFVEDSSLQSGACLEMPEHPHRFEQPQLVNETQESGYLSSSEKRDSFFCLKEHQQRHSFDKEIGRSDSIKIGHMISDSNRERSDHLLQQPINTLQKIPDNGSEEHLKVEISNANARLDNQKELISDLQASEEAKTFELQERNAKLENVIQSYKLDKDQLSQEIRTLKEELERISSSSILKDKVEQHALTKVAELELEREKLQSQILFYKEREIILSAELEHIKAELEEMSKTFTSKVVSEKQALEKLAELELEHEQLEAKLQFSKEQEAAWLSDQERLREEVRELLEYKEKKSILEMDIVDYKRREVQLRQYVQTLEQDVKAKSELQFGRRELMDQLEDCRNKEQNLRQSLRDMEEGFKETTKQLEFKVVEYEIKQEKLLQEIFDLKCSESMLQNCLMELEEREEKVAKKLQAEVERNSQLQKLLEERDVQDTKMAASNLNDGSIIGQQPAEQLLCGQCCKELVINTEFKVETPSISCDSSTKPSDCLASGYLENLLHVAKSQTTLSTSVQCLLLKEETSQKSVIDVSCMTDEMLIKKVPSKPIFSKGIQCDRFSVAETEANSTGPLQLTTSGSNHGESVSVCNTCGAQLSTYENTTLKVVEATKEDYDERPEDDCNTFKSNVELQEKIEKLQIKYGELCMDRHLQEQYISELEQHRIQLEHELDVSKAALNDRITISRRRCRRRRGSDESEEVKQSKVENAALINELQDLRTRHSAMENKLRLYKETNKTMIDELQKKAEEYHRLKLEHSEENMKLLERISLLDGELKQWIERSQQLKNENRRLQALNNMSIFDCGLAKCTTNEEQKDYDKKLQTNVDVECISGSGAATRFAVDMLKNKCDRLERALQKKQKCQQKNSYDKKKCYDNDNPKDVLTSHISKNATPNCRLEIQEATPPHRPLVPAQPLSLRNAKESPKPAMANLLVPGLIKENEDPLISKSRLSESYKHDDCKVS